MTLRNAFEGLTTDAMLRRVLNAVNFARTSTDQLRVVVDSGTISGLNQINWGLNNAEPTWYSTGAPNAMDTREMQKAAMKNNVMMARQRWTIT